MQLVAGQIKVVQLRVKTGDSEISLPAYFVQRHTAGIFPLSVHQSAAVSSLMSVQHRVWLQGASAAPLRSSVMLSQFGLFIKVLIQLH